MEEEEGVGGFVRAKDKGIEGGVEEEGEVVEEEGGGEEEWGGGGVFCIVLCEGIPLPPPSPSRRLPRHHRLATIRLKTLHPHQTSPHRHFR